MSVLDIPPVTLGVAFDALDTLTTRQRVLLRKQVEREHRKMKNIGIDVEQMFANAVVVVADRLRMTFPDPEGTRDTIVVKVTPPREDDKNLLYATLPRPLTEWVDETSEYYEEGTLPIPYNACNKDERVKLLRMGLAQGSFKLECFESTHHPDAKDIFVKLLEEERLTRLALLKERKRQMEEAYRMRGGANYDEMCRIIDACREFERRHKASKRTFRNRLKKCLSVFNFKKREDKL